jgi:hypothetical protein
LRLFQETEEGRKNQSVYHLWLRVLVRFYYFESNWQGIVHIIRNAFKSFPSYQGVYADVFPDRALLPMYFDAWTRVFHVSRDQTAPLPMPGYGIPLKLTEQFVTFQKEKGEATMQFSYETAKTMNLTRK